MVNFSILILSVPSRRKTFLNNLLDKLEKQINRNDVEILVLYDNKKRSVGTKRNNLLFLANGEFLTFIDDDDDITDDYISEIMKVIDSKKNIDCIVYDSICTIDNGVPIHCKYGIEYDYSGVVDGNKWFGKPAHTMIFKSSLAKKYSFPEINYGEDTNWAKKVAVEIKNQIRIEKILYFYKFNNSISETRK